MGNSISSASFTNKNSLCGFADFPTCQEFLLINYDHQSRTTSMDKTWLSFPCLQSNGPRAKALRSSRFVPSSITKFKLLYLDTDPLASLDHCWTTNTTAGDQSDFDDYEDRKWIKEHRGTTGGFVIRSKSDPKYCLKYTGGETPTIDMVDCDVSTATVFKGTTVSGSYSYSSPTSYKFQIPSIVPVVNGKCLGLKRFKDPSETVPFSVLFEETCSTASPAMNSTVSQRWGLS